MALRMFYFQIFQNNKSFQKYNQSFQRTKRFAKKSENFRSHFANLFAKILHAKILLPFISFSVQYTYSTLLLQLLPAKSLYHLIYRNIKGRESIFNQIYELSDVSQSFLNLYLNFQFGSRINPSFEMCLVISKFSLFDEFQQLFCKICHLFFKKSVFLQKVSCVYFCIISFFSRNLRIFSQNQNLNVKVGFLFSSCMIPPEEAVIFVCFDFSRIHSLEYQRFTTLGSKDMSNRQIK